ncbi:MAG: flavohemoglobin expression-modulating QEGLA motif protein [Woeseiaceae bacterium]|nr:flavohemoglobin expression-modulating QEGLA motif protein [Woeseiaceae bacterium]
MNIKKVHSLDERLVKASKKIRVLSTLSWPIGVGEKFLEGWRKGSPALPELKLQPPDIGDSLETLDGIASECDQDDPVEKFLFESATSYANAGRMLLNVGTRDFTKYSEKVYGRPDFVYESQGLSAVDGAKFLLEVTDNLLDSEHIQSPEADISAAEFSEWLKSRVVEFFKHDSVEVVIDETISAKALAGATRIRLRSSALFSQLDKDQLLQHEAFVHTATQLNGRKQTNLKSLGLGAPRTTRTQEGIAVLAELITNSIDISRLRRVALRVIAVKNALDGADFVDLFQFFLNAGQSETESVQSAQRVFRGGAVEGGVVFTKDGVYLQGLLEVHTLLRVAIRDNKPNLVSNLFAGRLTIADAVRLDPLFQSGWLVPPVYIPGWASDLQRLAASMAYSAFISNIKLDHVSLDRAIEFEKELNAVGQ